MYGVSNAGIQGAIKGVSDPVNRIGPATLQPVAASWRAAEALSPPSASRGQGLLISQPPLLGAIEQAKPRHPLQRVHA